MKRPLILFSTYFQASHQLRQTEINFSLSENLKNKWFNKIFIFTDNQDGTKELRKLLEKQPSSHVEIFELGRVPTFFDWLVTAKEKCKNSDLVFSNADIYFNESVQFLPKYINGVERLACISRHDLDEKGGLKLHASPHWSQDAWALQSETIDRIKFLDELKFPVGKPRCDNRLAYVFSVWGWSLFNPCYEIQAVHVHQSKIRTYEYDEIVNVGTVAYVHPCLSEEIPSFVDLSVFILKNSNVRKVVLNDFLEKKLKSKDENNR